MKIIVGISGGVDSSVAALLLKQQGHDVEALFMKNWHEETEDGGCMWEKDVEDAMQVCDKLEIPLNTVDLSREYWDEVFTNFLDEYKAGRTPNPDVLCNQEIKFKAFLEQAVHLGAEKLATGHYAHINEIDGCYDLQKSIDTNKDQTYFLCRLNQQQLSKTLFPLGELTKSEVRALAEQNGFITHDKKDSTGICFIGERPFREFLGQYVPMTRGEIKTTEGQTIGEHSGVFFYTLGQRQGLGIGGVQGAPDEPWYVVDKDIENNILLVGQGHDHPLLFSTGLVATNFHWINEQNIPQIPFACSGQTRYRQIAQPCMVEKVEQGKIHIRFSEPQRAVTPGQYVVLYDGATCLGSGVIESSWR